MEVATIVKKKMKIIFNFIAQYKLTDATPVKIKAKIFFTLDKKLKNNHINPRDKNERLDYASIAQLYDSFFSQKLIIIDKGFP